MDKNLRDTFTPNPSFFRVLTPVEREKRLRVLQKGEFEDIVLRQSHNSRSGGISNVPYRIKDAWFFAWGYLGGGPHDTAINILSHFSDRDFARDFCHEFVVEVIAKLPNEKDVLIPAAKVLNWISERRGKKSTHERYKWGTDCGQEHSWEFGSFCEIPRQLFVD